MNFLVLFLGIAIGYLIKTIFFIEKEKRINGIIHMDHSNDMCQFQFFDNTIRDPSVTHVIFKIDHNAKINIPSRDEQSL